MEKLSPIDPSDLVLPLNVRCYNGCYDSATQRVLDKQQAVLAKIREKEPDAHVTYFAHGPADAGRGEVHMVHAWGRPLSDYHTTRGDALADAYNRLVEAQVHG